MHLFDMSRIWTNSKTQGDLGVVAYTLSLNIWETKSGSSL